ncbi:MAG: TonB-dependent receptor [Bacteroides sp.]|jgi:outer membrane cobalamin receptor|nr:TonB-dependent receptor [Bacteroides sp.]
MKNQINILFFVLLALVASGLRAQDNLLRGVVMESQAHGDHFHLQPLVGANLVWLGTTQGAATDMEGRFVLEKPALLPHALVVSYIGYESDTLTITGTDTEVSVVLETARQLDEVVVAGRKPGAHYSGLEPVLTQVITESELQRAACCNLSEAFETNASIDVAYSDAVSGAQQIQLLGLAGIYSQILTENMPTLRGLGQPFGLSYTPGPWMESIQVSKGAASVINGYESITGQINVELKKPETAERLFYNFYGNDFGRLESTVNATLSLGPRWNTMVMAHGEFLNNTIDHNHDSFLDHPLVKKFNVINRYRYDRPGIMESQFGVRLMQEDREGGQQSFFHDKEDWGSLNAYGFGVNTRRYEAFAKTGFFFRNMPDASLGTQFDFSHHSHDSNYGLTTYDGTQNTFYANILFENTIAGNPNHRFTTGASFLFDDYRETLADSLFDRRETVPGVFGQYTMTSGEHFTLVAGLRADFHNLYGAFLTPRFHARYQAGEHTTFRASAGSGFRVPNLIAENTGLLVSNRRIRVLEEIEPERAWNYGGSVTRNLFLFGNDASLTAEYYRTDFQNQLIVDVDADLSEARFYNLDGRSFANNVQLEMSFEPVRRLEMTAAYRLTDVKTTINGLLDAKPFVNRYKGLLSGSYATRSNRWQFDLTAQFNGPSRIPSTAMLPEAFRMPEQSPAYTILHGQVTYRLRDFDLYLGGENLTNFRQKNPIIASADPFGEYFDGSMIWGPIMGRMFYLGLRYAIDR